MNKSKKLLVFHPALAPYRIDFFNALVNEFECHIVFLQRNNRNQNFNQQLLSAQSKFHSLYMKFKFVFKGRDINFGYIYYILKYKPDIIISIEYGLPTILSYLYKKLFRFKYSLYTICDDSIDIAKNCTGIRKLSRNFFVPRLSGIIFTSQNIIDWYKKYVNKNTRGLVFPIIKDELVYKRYLNNIIPISANLKKQFNLDNQKVILYVGRLAKVKNLGTLIRAFAKASPSQTTLVLVGDGEQKNHIVQDIDKLNIVNKVLLVGRKEGDELYAWYNIANLFVLPSKYEPFGAVTAEALQAGCKVICSNKAGSSVLINKTNGILFNPDDEEQLSRYINKFISDCDITNLNEARESILPYSFHDCINSLIKNLI